MRNITLKTIDEQQRHSLRHHLHNGCNITTYKIILGDCHVMDEVLHAWYGVLMVVVMTVAILHVTAPCSMYVNRRFGGTHHLHLQGRKSAKQFPGHLIHADFLLGWFSTLKTDVIRSPETSVHIRTT
jgi:hypothetical protein